MRAKENIKKISQMFLLLRKWLTGSEVLSPADEEASGILQTPKTKTKIQYLFFE